MSTRIMTIALALDESQSKNKAIKNYEAAWKWMKLDSPIKYSKTASITGPSSR